MLQVCGLSEEEVVYLEQACNTVLPGEAVGIDRMADAITLKNMEIERLGDDFCIVGYVK